MGNSNPLARSLPAAGSSCSPLRDPDRGGSYTSPGKTGRPAEPKTTVVTPLPTYLTIKRDGNTIASAISNAMNPYGGFPSQAPSFDGLGTAREGDDHKPDR